MIEIETRFGKCIMENKRLDYQVIVSFPKVDKENINELKDYFDKFGKFEKIIIGANYLLNDLGLSNIQNTNELTCNGFENPEIIIDTEKDISGCIVVIIRSIKLSNEERRYFGIERMSLEPKVIAKMIENIEKYEALKDTRKAFKELIEEDE